MIKKLKSYIQSRKDKIAQKWAEMDFEKEEKIEKIKKSRVDRSLKDAKTFLFHMVGTLVLLCLVPIVYILMARAVILEKDALDVVNAEEINISTVAYEDIVNDSTAIVNFNQIFNCSTWGSATTVWTNDHFVINGENIASGSWLWLGSGRLDSSHKYYLFIKQDNDWCEFVADGAGNNMRGVVSRIAYPSSSGDFTMYFRTTHTGAYNNYVVYVYCIDLTLMFGSQNDNLTLEQAQELFVADYYAYDTGSAVSLSGFNAYAQGVQSVLGSSVELSTEFIINNANPYTLPYNTKVGKIYYNYLDYDPDNGTDALITTGLYFMNGAYVPLGTTLSSGTNIFINFDFAVGNSNYNKCNIYSLNSNNVLSLISIIENDTYTATSINYVTSSDCIGIVFNLENNDNTRWQFYNLTISYPLNNYEQVIQNAYQNGYDSALNKYQVGNNGYNQIFEAGRLQGVEDAGNYTFLSLLTTAIDVPINSVLHMLDFDLLGMNMKSFYLSMFTFAIILFVIKLLI